METNPFIVPQRYQSSFVQLEFVVISFLALTKLSKVNDVAKNEKK